MEKPQQHAIKAWDYREIVDYIQNKHGVDLRDYAGKFSGKNSFGSWCDSKGYGQIDPDGKNRGESHIWCREFNQDVAEGKWIESPYLDFWHWIMDVCEIHNGCYFHVPIDYWKNRTIPENKKWIAEILKMFEEFADEKGDVFCWISW